MKNYYAILEVPVGCGVADIRQAYRRLAQDNLDNDAVFADLKEAHEVLTTPARRADYDRAVWGETFADAGGQALVPGAADGATLLPGAVEAPASAGGVARCPMGAEAQCPVLLGRTGPSDTYCPECGFLLAGLGTAAVGLEAAGATGAAGADEAPWLEEPSGRSHRLRGGLNMVGRESADILLPDKTVSRQHARLEVSEDGVVTVEDLSSTNGTQVGGDVLVPHMARTLQAGDRVRFGSVVTELRLPAGVLGETGPAEESQSYADPAPADPSPADPSPADPSPVDSIPTPPPGPARAQVVETREEGGRTFRLVPGVSTFGRRAENSFIIQGDPYVSGSHAQIIADGGLFRLTDVGSTNGTLLNGRRLAINEPETLSPEDVILIGGTALRFEMLDVIEETPIAEDADGEAGLADAPAKPPARNAQEYDAPTHDAPTHDALSQTER